MQEKRGFPIYLAQCSAFELKLYDYQKEPILVQILYSPVRPSLKYTAYVECGELVLCPVATPFPTEFFYHIVAATDWLASLSRGVLVLYDAYRTRIRQSPNSDHLAHSIE